MKNLLRRRLLSENSPAAKHHAERDDYTKKPPPHSGRHNKKLACRLSIFTFFHDLLDGPRLIYILRYYERCIYLHRAKIGSTHFLKEQHESRNLLSHGQACLCLIWASRAFPIAAQEPAPSAERGQKALFTRSFVPAVWGSSSYENAWKHWDKKPAQPPSDYPSAFREYYGVHSAPFDNGRYPMGLREAATVFGGKGIAIDCMLCHGSSILGKSYVGLGNSSVDVQALWSDLSKGSFGSGKTPVTFSETRGTVEVAKVVALALSYREPDLSLRFSPLDFGAIGTSVEDVPAWWLLKKKKTMYHAGVQDARSVRSLMSFMLTPFNSAQVIAKEEATFRDIRAYLQSLEAQKYPLPIDQPLAKKGEAVFNTPAPSVTAPTAPTGPIPTKSYPLMSSAPTAVPLTVTRQS